MDDIEKLKKENEDLKSENATLKKENAEFKDSNTKLGEDLKKKDEEIIEAKRLAKERGAEFQKFRDMTKEQKDLLSDQERALLERIDKFEDDVEKDKKDRAERDQKERDARIDRIAKTIAKGDEEIAKQIKVNLSKLNPEILNKAITEEELTPLVTDAFNMAGVTPKVDAINQAHNQDGSPAEVSGDKNFADTGAGKDLAGKMGLTQAVEPEKK